jgi:uncharacterized protein (DUF362 family)
LPDYIPMTRRYFFFGAIALGATACGRKNSIAITRTSPVSIRRAASYQTDLEAIVRSILAEHRVDAKGKRIVLKPNLVEFDPKAPINTHPVFVAAVANAFHAAGAASVRVAEGPGHRRTTLDLADSAGYFREYPSFEDTFTDLNLDDVQLVKPARPFSPRLASLYLPKTILGADLVVSLPKMKTHHWVGVTLSMKNLFGIVPGAVYGWPKNTLHWAGIPQSIATLQQVVPRQFCIVDGIEGMEGNGPILGTSKPAGVIVAGADPVEVDSTCCRIMRVDPTKVDYIRLATNAPSQARQIGESIRSVQTRFVLAPAFEYLRLAANS